MMDVEMQRIDNNIESALTTIERFSVLLPAEWEDPYLKTLRDTIGEIQLRALDSDHVVVDDFGEVRVRHGAGFDPPLDKSEQDALIIAGRMIDAFLELMDWVDADQPNGSGPG